MTVLRDYLSDVEWCLPWNRKRIQDVWRWPHVFWMNIFGWWGEEAPGRCLKVTLPWLRRLVVAHALSMSGAMVVASCEKFAKGDIMTNMFTVFASGIATTGMFKMIQIVIHRAVLKEAMDSLSDLTSECRTEEDEAHLRRGLRGAWLVFLFSLVSGSCITLHWLCRPILAAAVYGEKTRIVDTWPVLLDDWSQFAVSYAFQSPGVSSIGHSFYLYDNVYFCLCHCTLAHLGLLKMRLRRLRYASRKNLSVELASCVRYHDKLIRICNLIRHASTSSIIFQCTNTVVMACSGVFVMTMSESLDTNVLMNLVEILLIITVVLYSYCWYSNEISYQLEDVLGAAYMSGWNEWPLREQKSLHILMTRTTVPVRFGGILLINLGTFIAVLKTIFSYYNFLLAVYKS